eukprot:3266761-Prymnesium_polylepis.1
MQTVDRGDCYNTSGMSITIVLGTLCHAPMHRRSATVERLRSQALCMHAIASSALTDASRQRVVAAMTHDPCRRVAASRVPRSLVVGLLGEYLCLHTKIRSHCLTILLVSSLDMRPQFPHGRLRAHARSENERPGRTAAARREGRCVAKLRTIHLPSGGLLLVEQTRTKPGPTYRSSPDPLRP